MEITVVNPLELPFVNIQETYKLPNSQGIYFVVAERQVVYIGYSLNFRKRWANHHRYRELVDTFSELKISWLIVKDASIDYLKELEDQCISFWKPKINFTRIKQDTVAVSEDLVDIPKGEARALYKLYRELKSTIGKGYVNEIKALKQENQELKKENQDLKTYMGALRYYYESTQRSTNQKSA